MKTIIALIVGLCLPALGGTVRLAWTASITPGVTNYVVRAVGPGATNNVATVAVGTNLTAEVETTVAGVWGFSVAAEKDAVRSDWSNVVLVDMPEAPTQGRVVAVEAALNLVGTNWINAGYFRLKITTP